MVHVVTLTTLPLVLLFAVLLIMGGAEAQVMGTPEPKEKGAGVWPFLLISIILAVSISFEMLKEFIEEKTPHDFIPITDAFFGELATLGFIGAIAFTLTYNFDSNCVDTCTVMQNLSDKFLGEPEELQDIFEGLHFMLFAISVVFILVVLILLKMTLVNAETYEELEKKINQATSTAAEKKRKNAERRRKSIGSGSRSQSPDKCCNSPARRTPQQQDQTALNDCIRNFEHENLARQESEARLMAGTQIPDSPTTPNAPLASLLSGQGFTNQRWYVGNFFANVFKPDEVKNSEYFRLRHRFIDDEQECVSVPIPHDFDYGQYLKKTLAHTYAHIIELSPVDWGVLWMVMGIVYAVYYLNPQFVLYIFASLEMGLLLLSWIVLTKIMHIRCQLLSPGALVSSFIPPSRGNYAPPSLDLIDETVSNTGVTHAQVTPADERDTCNLILNTTDLGEATTPIPPRGAADDKSLSFKTGVTLIPPPYLSRKYHVNVGRSWHSKCLAFLYGKTVNRHQSLFWMGANGVAVIRHIVKLVLFGAVVNSAVLVINMRPQIMDLEIALPLRYLLMIGAIVAPMMTLVTIPVTIGLLNEITSVETMKDEDLLVKVMMKQKSEKNKMALEVLSSLQFLLDQADNAASLLAETGNASTEADVHRLFNEFCKDPKMKVRVEELRLLFYAFDKDHSGAIDRDELGDLLACMGQNKSSHELDRLFNLMDADGSEDVDFEEFCAVMLRNRKNNIDPHAMAEKMYLHFDSDGDGQVSPDEMIEAFQKMGRNWDVDDIHAFLVAIDTDGSGTIEKEEFVSFVTGFLADSNDH